MFNLKRKYTLSGERVVLMTFLRRLGSFGPNLQWTKEILFTRVEMFIFNRRREKNENSSSSRNLMKLSKSKSDRGIL